MSANFVFWQHTTHSVSHDLFRFAIEACFCCFRTQPSVAGVPSISFLVQLVARELDLVAICQNNKFSSVYVGRVSWAMFSHQDNGDVRCDSTDDLIFSVDDEPTAFDCVSLSVV